MPNDWVSKIFIIFFLGEIVCDDERIYLNKWAVEIKGGKDLADWIAQKHGFNNLGQIGALKDVYEFEHRRLQKRSLDPTPHNHELLLNDDKVVWAEQQVAKKRVKRDGLTDDLMPRPVRHTPQVSFNDPLWADMWFLHGGAWGGYDMNVKNVWERGYTGRGVVISILDDGIEHTHPDLKANYDPLASYDINGHDKDPMPRYDDRNENKHGTRCAGEVAAVANNSYCTVGVAYNANIGGVRMLDGDVSDSVEAMALGHNPQYVDIYSASWGPDDNGKVVDGPAKLAQDSFINGVINGRQGKGSIFVWASGNGGSAYDSCSCDGYTNSVFTLSVSSVTEHNGKPWYLEECPSTLVTTYSSGENYRERKIVTTDLHGQCTNEHTGTSASAPLASALIALALEANPNLTWRDMQYLVLRTANTKPFVDAEWVTNAVGRKVSHRYGYGLMDGEALVKEAERWTTVPEQHICSTSDRKMKHKIDSTGIAFRLDTDACEDTPNHVKYLEHVQAKISLRYSARGDLVIYLTSPAGTTSKLLPKRPMDHQDGHFVDWPFMSVFYWGEDPTGSWTLDIRNEGPEYNRGIITKWQLIMYGTDIDPVRLKPPMKKPPIRYWNNTDENQPDNANIVVTDSLGGSTNMDAEPVKIHTGSEEVIGGDDMETHSGDEHYWIVDDNVFESSLPVQGLVTSFPLSSTEPGMPSPTVSTTVVATPSHPKEDGDLMKSTAGIGTGLTDSKVAILTNTERAHDQKDTTAVSSSLSETTPTLYPCHAQCLPENGCTGPLAVNCVACKNFRLEPDGICVQDCPMQSYSVAETKSCYMCELPCFRCTGSDVTRDCISCIDGFLFLEDEGNCVEACPTGYFSFEDTFFGMVCRKCAAKCASCSGSSALCTSCREGYEIDGGICVIVCADNEFKSDMGSCQPCHTSCSTCYGPGPHHCTRCEGDLLFQNGTCVYHCSIGHYEIMSTDGLLCRECHGTCADCIGPGTDSCLACIPPLILVQGSCEESCPTGYYEGVDARCYACDVTCHTCAGPEPGECLTCDDYSYLQRGNCLPDCTQGYFPFEIWGLDGSRFGVCEACHPSCFDCSGPLASDCEICPPGLYLSAGECLTECPLHEYEGTDGLCYTCHPACLGCRGAGKTECTSCKEPMLLLEGECLQNCPAGVFEDIGECFPCYPSCSQCFGGSIEECLACQVGFVEFQGICMDEALISTFICRSNQFFDHILEQCVDCDATCSSCTGPGPDDCLSCHVDRIYRPSYQQCIPCCSVHTLVDCCICSHTVGFCPEDFFVSSSHHPRISTPADSIVPSSPSYTEHHTYSTMHDNSLQSSPYTHSHSSSHEGASTTHTVSPSKGDTSESIQESYSSVNTHIAPDIEPSTEEHIPSTERSTQLESTTTQTSNKLSTDVATSPFTHPPSVGKETSDKTRIELSYPSTNGQSTKTPISSTSASDTTTSTSKSITTTKGTVPSFGEGWFEREWSTKWTILVVVSSVALLVFIIVFVLLLAKVNKRLCWKSHFYQPVPTIYQNGKQPAVLTKVKCNYADEENGIERGAMLKQNGTEKDGITYRVS